MTEEQEEEAQIPTPQSPLAKKKNSKKKGKESMLTVSESPREKFINVAAKAKFEELKERELLPERGFESDMKKLPLFVSTLITNHSWRHYVRSLSQPSFLW